MEILTMTEVACEALGGRIAAEDIASMDDAAPKGREALDVRDTMGARVIDPGEVMGSREGAEGLSSTMTAATPEEREPSSAEHANALPPGDAEGSPPDARKDPERSVSEARSLEDLVLARLREYASSLKGHDARDMYALIMPQLERPLIRVALELAGGRQTRAATMLGIHRNTLRIRLRELGLEPERPNTRPKRAPR